MIAILLVIGLLSGSNQITSYAQDENPDQTSENTLLLPSIQGNDNNAASTAETTGTFETLLPSISAEEQLVRASSVSYKILMEPYNGTSAVPAGQSTNIPYNHQIVEFEYTGGDVTLTACIDLACTWAADDAIRLVVTHEDTSVSGPVEFLSYTADYAPVDITSMFAMGDNVIDVYIVDKYGPVYGLPRTLYVVESIDPLPNPDLSIETIPVSLVRNNNKGYSLDPVDTLTGAFVYGHSDISIAGRGPTPTFVRSYNSSDTRTGILGPAWTHNYNMRLSKPFSTTDDVIVFDAQGNGSYYTEDSGDYIPPSGITDELVKTGDGTYMLTAKDQTRWMFSETGLLLRIIDRYGNQSILSYEDDLLTSVSDPAGRGNVILSYNGSGLLESVTDWMSREVSYTYDGNGRLQTVTDRIGETTTYAYDSSSSRLTTITDARSNVAVTNTYSDGKVATQKDAYGLVTSEQTSFVYATNIDGTKTTTVTYPATSYDSGWDFQEVHYHDTDGNLSSLVSKPTATSSEWITETYTYDSNGFRTSVTDGRGNTTHYCYDVDYSGSSISGSYGNLTRVIGPQPTGGANRPVTLFTYDGNNNLTQEVAPKGVPSGTTVTCSTNLSSIDTNYSTNYEFDSGTSTLLEAITRSYTDPDLGTVVVTTTYEYDDDANPGLVTRMVPPRGNVGSPNLDFATTFEYGESGSHAGMLIEVTAPLTTVTTYEYDSVGRMIAMVDPKGNAPGATAADHTWVYTYDDEDRQLTISAPPPVAMGSPLVTEYQYDEVGNRVVQIDANGQVTLYVYDDRDSLQEVQQSPDTWTVPSTPPGTVIVTSYEYDHLGNLKRVTRADGDMDDERVTDYTFDGLGRVREESQYPSWPSTSSPLVTEYTYDRNSNRATLVSPLNKTTTYGYDTLNRLTSITYNDVATPNVTYAYDANNNRSSMVDGTGTTSYTYDEWNRLLTVTSPGSVVVSYRYDRHNNRIELTYPDSDGVDYSFNEADRLTSVTDWDLRVTTYDYFVDGSVQTLIQHNGTSTHYTYDNANRLTQVWNRYGSDTFTRHTYTLDEVGNRIQAEEVLSDGYYAGAIDPSHTGWITYTYDSMYRLITEHRDLPIQSHDIHDYEYDPVGNRVYWSLTSGLTMFLYEETEYTYDKADRILSAEEDNDETFTVDANGNIVSRGVFGTKNLVYDQENRHIQDGTDYYYKYNGDGNRTKVRERSGFSIVDLNTYVWDINEPLPMLLQETTHGFQQETRKYVYGLGLLYTVDDDDNPGFYGRDGLGSMRFITDYRDEDPPRRQMYEDYDAFGNEGYSNKVYVQSFKFAGEQDDESFATFSGYVYLRARFYDPMLGRFLSRDRYAGSIFNPLTLNRYTYVENNPVNKTDPSGLASSKVLEEIPFDLAQSPTADDSASFYVFSCKDAPIGPSDVNLQQNMMVAESMRDMGLLKHIWFYYSVKTGGPWDLKTHGKEYEAYGNYHFGAVGKAAGYSNLQLLAGAGIYQIYTFYLAKRANRPSPPIALPFGDDPPDQRNIRFGIYCN